MVLDAHPITRRQAARDEIPRLGRNMRLGRFLGPRGEITGFFLVEGGKLKF